MYTNPALLLLHFAAVVSTQTYIEDLLGNDRNIQQGQGHNGRIIHSDRVIHNDRLIHHKQQQVESSTVRFLGKAYIHFDFNRFAVLQPALTEVVRNETFYFKFITKQPDGLIWLDNRDSVSMFLIMKNIEHGKKCDGYLSFVLDEGMGRVHHVTLRPVGGVGDLNDWRWHSFLIERIGHHLRFYINDVHAGELTTHAEIPLVGQGQVYLGGSPHNLIHTDGFVHTRFDGAITEVMFSKYSVSRIVVVNLLSHLETLGITHGEVVVYPHGYYDHRHDTHHPHPTQRPRPTHPPRPTHRPRPTHPPRPTHRPRPTHLPRPTHRPRPTHPPRPPTILIFHMISITHYDIHHHLRGYLDIRRGGTIRFRFRSLSSEGILFITGRGIGTGSMQCFVALEVVDSLLYFVYHFGVRTERVQITSTHVTDGAWHNVHVDFSQTLIRILLDNQPIRIDLTNIERDLFYFDSGIFIGGMSQYHLSQHLYSRNGFIGCLGSFELINIVTQIEHLAGASLPGVSDQCPALVRHCDRPNVCGQGSCHYSVSREYYCRCAGTGYGGRHCDQWPVTGHFDGAKYIVYRYPQTHVSYTNDISIRFLTALQNVFFFTTHADRYDNFIRVQMENGCVKVKLQLHGHHQEHCVGSNLHDNNWHTLYLRRLGDMLHLWIDDGTKLTETIHGSNLQFHMDKVYFGSHVDLPIQVHQNYIGFMHNVYFNHVDVFEELKQYQGGHYPVWILTREEFNRHFLSPVTFVTRNSFVRIQHMRQTERVHMYFKFRTSQHHGVMFFMTGHHDKYLAIELVDGYLHFKCNNGYSNEHKKIPTARLHDSQWHTFELIEIVRGDQRRIELRLDAVSVFVDIDIYEILTLAGDLYIGGLSQSMFRESLVQKVFTSTYGYIGCMDSIKLNGHVIDVMRQIHQEERSIISGCHDIQACAADSCMHGGVCSPGLHGITCDCTYTGRAGARCGHYPLGVYFGRHRPRVGGVISYEFQEVVQSVQDRIAFGFMTYYGDGTLCRIESINARKNIEIKLVGGVLMAVYNIGHGEHILRLGSTHYHEGRYHVVQFYRTRQEAVFTVDGVAVARSHALTHYVFDNIRHVYIGGLLDVHGRIIHGFNGIIGGFSWNNYRFIDLAHESVHHFYIKLIQDVYLITENFYILIIHPHWPTNPTPPHTHTPRQTTPKITTYKPTTPIPPITSPPTPPVTTSPIPPVTSPPIPPVTSPPITPVTSPPVLLTTSPPIFPGTTEAVRAEGGVVPVPPGFPGNEVRAGALVGSILGTMAFLASLMWAFWQCKPGMITCPRFGGGGGGPPVAATQSTQVATVPSAPSGAGAGTGSGVGTGSGAGTGSGVGTSVMDAGAGAGAGGAKVAIVESGTGGGGGVSGGGGGVSGTGAGTGGYGTSAFSSYYASSSQSAVGGGGTGGAMTGGGAGSSNMFYGGGGTGIIGGGGKTTYMYSKETTTYKGGSGGMGGAMGGSSGMSGGSFMDSSVLGQSTTADYDLAIPSASAANYQSNVLSTSAGGTTSRGGYSSMNKSYNYKVQSMRTMTSDQTGSRMLSYKMDGDGVVTTGGVGDEVRVDCCLMTNDGRSVVTGSSLGPPQVWDMQTGELLRIMKGDTVGSTNLHLACNDRLLVGAVHADLEVNEYSTRKGVTNKKLQIWDFSSGRPLDMRMEQTCSALCVMSDPTKVVLGRTEPHGTATTIIVWDLEGNQAEREMKYTTPAGNNDYINFLTLSPDDRYCVAGFTNSSDSYAEFFVFDMNQTGVTINNPSLLRLNANQDCTAILSRDEAVTGLRNGDLVIWNLRSAQPQRKVYPAPGIRAHSKEVKAVVLSDDRRYLVSASCDGTLKIWSVQGEKLVHTLTGHTDEVWCAAISPDNEVVVSGSRDGSIRLWRVKDGSQICAFNTGNDVFYVTMSHDKGTIVALGDRFGTRKLIMLQVVRTKIKRLITS